jgi:hypothetical protein
MRKQYYPLCKSKWCLHSGKNRAKLGFLTKIFCHSVKWCLHYGENRAMLGFYPVEHLLIWQPSKDP